jgi:hypothetical protein
MTLEDLKDYYAARLIAQYRLKPKAIATIKLLINQAWADGLPISLQTAFNLNTAAGAQLDIIGRIVGAPRNIYGLDLTHTYWEWTTYSGTPAGTDLGRYTDDPYPSELWQRYILNSIAILNDEQLLALIRLKIVHNNNNGSFKDILDRMYAYFGAGIVITDNLDSTVTFDVEPEYAAMMKAADFVGDIIPKPMGIGYTINYL